MSIALRHYQHPEDYQRIDAFLTAHYQPDNQDRNWIEPAWEYMHAHPMLDARTLGKIGIWEDGSDIVAVATYESRLGEAFFQFHPAYHHLREEMLAYAEENLSGISSRDGRKYLCAYVNDNDAAFQELVSSRGYQKNPEDARQMAAFSIPNPFPPISLAPGFRLTSLAEDCDWRKVNRVLWRGFDHEGEPPDDPDELESRRRMFQTPNARMALKIAAQAPDGGFAAFCGMFYEPTRRFAYVEPVATDPAYRHMGLGKAAVLEGIRRCAEVGATVVFVGNDLPIYRSIGFKVIYTSECWVKYLS